MARMPGAIWRPLAANWASMPRITSWDIFCLHTMVGSLDGTDGYFRTGNGTGYTGTESHFGVGHDGTIYQWQDTDFQADANYRGGWHVISSENADTGTGFRAWDGSDVPAFTSAQVEANARIAVWLHETHDIPLDLIPDSKPGRRGIGWHRLGIPGYVVDGGELWSKAAYKSCPGDRRIAQIPQIATRARQLVAGATPGGFLMALNDDQQGQLYNTVVNGRAVDDRWQERVENLLRDTYNAAAQARTIASQARALATAASAGADIDEKALAAALAPAVIATLGEAKGISADDLEVALRRVLGSLDAA